MLKDWSLQIPEQCGCNSSHHWLSSKPPFERGSQVFPSDILTFGLWVLVMDPRFVATSNAAQKTVTDVDTFMLMLFVVEPISCKLYGSDVCGG
jgi:hypothetical protein